MLAHRGSLSSARLLPDSVQLQRPSPLKVCDAAPGSLSAAASARFSSSEAQSRSPTSVLRIRPSVTLARGAAKRRKLATAATSNDAHAPLPLESPAAETTAVAPVETLQQNTVPPSVERDQLNQLMFSPALFSPIRKPRNPIVLCHGLYGFDVRGPAGSSYQLHYWGAILEILRGKVGAEVIVSRVPGTGSVEGRAKALDAVLRKEVAGRDINLLAHSMGGLDARYLISNIRPDAYNVLSLTTVSTPHRGSPFMEWCSSTIGLGRDGEQADETARSTLAHWMGLGLAEYFAALFDSPAYRDLLPSYLEKRFNPSTPDVPSVRYYSVAARSGDLGIWHPLYWPKTVLDAAEAKAASEGKAPSPALSGNDGLVAVESARWGEFLGVVENCDHWRIRGSSGFRSTVPLSQDKDQSTVPQISDQELKEVRATLKPDVDAEPTRLNSVTKASDAALEKAAGGRSWSWEDVNTIVDPLKALVSPLNKLLSLVPTLSSSNKPASSGTSSTTHYITPSLTFSSSSKLAETSPTSRYMTLSHGASPPASLEKQASRSSLLSFLYSSSTSSTAPPLLLPTSPTTRYIQLSAPRPTAAISASSSRSSSSGLLSYFRRAPSYAPSPTTRHLQLSLAFSPKRETPPSAFRAIPNLSTLLAPPSFFGSSTQKAAQRRNGAAAEAGAKDAFDLERLYVALARKLHDEGL